MRPPDFRLLMAAVMLTGHFAGNGCFCMTQPFSDANTAERADLVRCLHSRKELRALQGTWAATYGKTDGQQWAPGKVVKFQMTLQGGRYSIACGAGTEEGAFRLAARNGIDLMPATGADAGQIISGIYRAEPDRLVLCLAGPYAKRPAGFSAEERSEQVLLIFRRAG